MTSFEKVSSALADFDYDGEQEEENEQWEKVIQKLKQQCSEERAKRLRLEFSIETCKRSVGDINFAFALNQMQNKSFTSFRMVLEENLRMQEKLVENIKSHDWELANGLWRFKIKTLKVQKEQMAQHFQKQRDLWKMKMRSIPEFNDIQRIVRLVKEKERNLLELQEQWKIRNKAVTNKFHRTNKHFEEMNTALDSSEKIVTDLKQQAENLETEIRHLDASKLEEMRLIKDLEKDLKRRPHMQTKKIVKKENLKNYRRKTITTFIDVLGFSPFPVFNMEKGITKTFIKDGKPYESTIPNMPEKLVNLPIETAENISRSGKKQLEITENINLRPDKEIKILEQVILKSPMPWTTKGTISEQNDSAPVVNVVESLSCKTAEILNISKNKSPSDVQDLKQSNEETNGGNLFDRQLMKQSVHDGAQMGEKVDISYTTKSNTKDENKISQVNKMEHMKVFEKNILKLDELKEKEKRAEIVLEDEKFEREENAGIEDFRKMSVNKTKSVNMSFLKFEEQKSLRDAEYRQKNIKVGDGETDVNRKFGRQELSVTETISSVNKRKFDETFSEENLNPKQFKMKGNDSDFSRKSDFKPGQSGKVSAGNHSDSENNVDNILRKAFELCNIPESTKATSEDTETNLNDNFESFFGNLITSESHSWNLEKGSNQSSDDTSGWGVFGNNFEIGDNNKEDEGFFK